MLFYQRFFSISKAPMMNKTMDDMSDPAGVRYSLCKCIHMQMSLCLDGMHTEKFMTNNFFQA